MDEKGGRQWKTLDDRRKWGGQDKDKIKRGESDSVDVVVAVIVVRRLAFSVARRTQSGSSLEEKSVKA